MLEILVLKNLIQCTSQRVERTSEARDLTTSFQQLPKPKFFHQISFSLMVFLPELLRIGIWIATLKVI